MRIKKKLKINILDFINTLNHLKLPTAKKLIENLKKRNKSFKIIFLKLKTYHVNSCSIQGDYKIYCKLK
jgi:hypothetical protein